MAVEAIQSPVEALPTLSLCNEIERLCRLERTAAWLLCHHCAQLADRFDAGDPVLCGYEDIHTFATLRFAMPKRAVRERVRVGRALRALPLLHSAFAEGQISYAKVREVTRVADLDTEAQWLETARTESVRSLERKVGRARRPEQEAPFAAATVRSDQSEGFVNVEMRLPETTWSVVRRAMEVARSKSLRPLTDAEALEAVARWSLASEAGPNGPDAAAISSCGPAAHEDRVADEEIAASGTADDELPFAAELRARLRREVSSASACASGGTEATRPGQADAPSVGPSAHDDRDLLTPAPGRPELREESVEPARLIVGAIERQEATNHNDLCEVLDLPVGRIASAMIELMVAGILVDTHRGLALTPWAKRNRFRASPSKSRH